ncbi:MAG TPA: NUDIX hydrolase [Candidatus Magasanikbacteria bacterium]|nr:NUDIX hydrolase [Candidatus Magasanikbacteria bacterium]
MGYFKKLEEQIYFESFHMVGKRDLLEDKSGNKFNYFYGIAPGGALVIPVLSDGRIALVYQYRYLQDKKGYEFPRGAINPGESPNDAAKRELEEETGCMASDLIKVGTFVPSPPSMKDIMHVFVAEADHTGSQKLDFNEYMEVVFRRPDEIDEMVRRGEIWDGVTLAAWAMAHHQFLHKDKLA